VIQLNGHATPGDTPAKVPIPVRGLEQFCEHLRTKAAPRPEPVLVDTSHTNRNTELNLDDPLGSGRRRIPSN
jgi:hypothetical protein